MTRQPTTKGREHHKMPPPTNLVTHHDDQQDQADQDQDQNQDQNQEQPAGPDLASSLLRPETRENLMRGSKPELERFRQNLARAMQAKKMSASTLARAVWGTTTDSRGYTVPRNRDRITHYLAGTGYPAPAAVTKMAQALGIDPALLAKDYNGLTPGAPAAEGCSGEKPPVDRLGISMAILAPVGGHSMAQLTLHYPVPLAAAQEIARIYMEALEHTPASAPKTTPKKDC
jgi:hypothetical protein